MIISTQRDYINCHHGVIKSPVQRYINIRVSVVSFIIVYSTRDTEDSPISFRSDLEGVKVSFVGSSLPRHCGLSNGRTDSVMS